VASPTSSAREHYGSITSLASSTSLISPHELQQLIEEANQSLSEAGTPSHEIIVAVIHREPLAGCLGGSIGITLAGGADYDNKEISVNKVITGSVADRDGRIKKGDRVISINGRASKGMTHREALHTLKAPRAEVVLVLSRSRSVTPHDPTSDDPCGYQRHTISKITSRPPKILESPLDSSNLASELAAEDACRSPPSVIILRKEGAGLGFSLQGGKDSPLGDRPLVVKKIFTGGAAYKSGELHVHDQILAINDQDIQEMARIEAWTLLKKQPDGPVRLTIRRWVGVAGQGAGQTDTSGQSVTADGGKTDRGVVSQSEVAAAVVSGSGGRSADQRASSRAVVSDHGAASERQANVVAGTEKESVESSKIRQATDAASERRLGITSTAVSSPEAAQKANGDLSAATKSPSDAHSANDRVAPPTTPSATGAPPAADGARAGAPRAAARTEARASSRPVITGVTPKASHPAPAVVLPKA